MMGLYDRALLGLAAFLAACFLVLQAGAADFSGRSISGTGQDQFTWSNSIPADSKVLQTSCASVQVSFVPDLAGAEVVATAHVFRCGSLDTDTCRKILADRNGDGLPEDQPLTGNETTAFAGYQWVQTGYVLVKGSGVTATGSANATAAVIVRCSGS